MVLTIYPANQLYHQFKTKENVAEIQEKIEKNKLLQKRKWQKVEQIKSNSGNQGVDNTQKTDKGVGNTQETDGGSFDIGEAEGKVNPYTGDVFQKSNERF